jgi:2,4-diaminopentanoate dehydrogenase
MTDPLRVAVWATGWVGSLSVRAIHERPDLELAGVWVHSAEKVGRDAGEIVGLGPIGVEATNDADALLDLGFDCVCYTASGPERDAATIPDYVTMLERGINVVTVSTPGLVFPLGFHADTRARLDDAAQRGGATLYASGIEPGFAGDHLVLTLATQLHTIHSVRTQELFRYDTYPVTFMMFDVFGFGHPLEYTPLMSLCGAQLGTWGPPVQMVAYALGVELDEIRETYDRRVTDRTLEVAAGTIEAGTVGAIRMETIGVVNGRDAIVIEHVNRMADDIAPDWPVGARDGTYRILIDGEPSIQCEMTVGTEENASADGMLVTAMRIVNAIPHVVNAPPGLVSALDLPLTLPRGMVR